MGYRRLAAALVGVAVGGIVLATLFAVVGLGGVLDALAGASPPLVVIAGALLVGWTLTRALAFAAILNALEVPARVFDAALVTAGAGVVTHLVPLGQASSEPVAAWLLTDAAETDFETGLAAIASLDALNVVVSLALAALGVGYYALTATLASGLAALAAGVLAVAIALPAGAAIAWRYRRTLRDQAVGLFATPVGWLTARLPMESRSTADVSARIDGFVAALERVAADRRRVAIALGFAAAGWACQALALWAALLAVGTSVPVFVPFFVVPIGATARIVPTPGGVGGIETVNTTLVTLATGANAPRVLAGVTIHGVGGVVLAIVLGAVAIALIRVRGSERAPTQR